MKRAYYGESIQVFLHESTDSILGKLLQASSFSVESTQRDAWLREIEILKGVLGQRGDSGGVYLEYSVPRLGKRIDAVVLLGAAILVLEFKVGESEFTAHAIDQVYDYAVDLKNFHETSHDAHIAPILIATAAQSRPLSVCLSNHGD